MKNFNKINHAFMAKKKHFALLCALLCASMMGWAINWDSYGWIGNGTGNAAYTDAYKMTLANGQSVVNIQHPGFATATGIYTTFPAGVSACSLPAGTYDIQGAGMILHMDAFTAKETEVTVTHGTGTAVFTVYYKDGTPAVADTEKPVMTSATCSSTTHNSATIAVAATDNVGVTKYVVKNGGSELGEYSPNAGVIVVEDLTASTNYTLTVFAKDAAGNVSASGIDVACNTTAIPSSPYCNTEIAHFDNPVNDSYILLSVGSDGHGHTIVNIKQDNAKNSNTFDYINIVGKKDIGSDIATGGAAEMAIVFETPTPDGSGNITFTVQWSKVGDGGRWQHEITVPANATCSSADPFPGNNHLYCNYTDGTLRTNNANAELTWSTNNSGDVIIELSDGEGASNTHFRNEGFEYGGKSMDLCWMVYSGTNHLTSECASEYFTVEQAVDGGNTYALRKKNGVTLPANAVVAFVGRAFSWKNDQDGGAYTLKAQFGYTYGGACPYLDTPTNVAIDGSKHITFNSVENAENYTACVYLNNILKHRQDVSSGDALTFVPYTTGTYQVEVTASAAGYLTSDPSDAYNWALTADPVVVGNSEYCEWALPTFVADAVDCDANLTIETDNDGDVTITLLPLDEQTAVFRDDGMKLSDFKVGEVRTAASEYFNRTYTKGGSTVVLTLKDPDVKPGLGEKIYFSGYVECTVNGHSTWPTASLTYTYGAKCSGQKHVTVDVNNNEMGSATVDGKDEVYVDDNTQVTCVATPAEGYEFVNWTVGGVEVSTLATYQPTITAATNLVANFDYARTTYCHAAVQTNGNKKVYLTVGKGATEGTYQIKIYGSNELTITGINNANTAINHVKYLTYDGNDVPLTIANGGWTYSSEGYGVITSAELRPQTGYTWRDMWMWRPDLYMGTSAGEQNINGILDNEHYFNWDNDCSDIEAPVLAAPSALAINSTDVRLTLSATDNWGGTITYNVNYKPTEDAGEGVTITPAPQGASGQEITVDVEGLTTNTEYTFTVTASDGTYVSEAQSCTATPAGDTEAPVITSFTATPSYGYVDLAITATDDMGNNLTFTITYGEENVEVEGAPGVEVTKRIYAMPNTSLSFSVVATDAASHTSSAATASATTLIIPAAPTPTHNAALVRSIYSNAYTPTVANTFRRSNFGGAGLLAETDYMLYRMNTTLIVWGHNDENAGYGNIDGSSGYTYGDNTGLDVSGMDYLHMDVWCDASDQLNTININDANVTIPTTRTIAQQWVSFDIAISSLSAEARQNLRWLKILPFNTTNCLTAIDNVYFYNLPTALEFGDDATNNSSIISANDGKLANVTINRNINADNTWYTLCLPFDMDADKVNEVFGASTIATLTGSEDRGSLIHLNFEYVDAMEAGKPYMIKVSNSFASGTQIEGVTIKNVGPTEVGDDVMKFVGTYDKIMLTGENKRYVSANNTLYSPNPDGGSAIGAFRCYFTIPDGSSASAPGKQARIVFGPQNATGIDLINDSSKSNGKLLINGVLYIIRDGNTYNAQGMLVK